jgi:hypothetical protein
MVLRRAVVLTGCAHVSFGAVPPPSIHRPWTCVAVIASRSLDPSRTVGDDSLPRLLLGDASGSRSVWPLQFMCVVSRPMSRLLGARTHCHPQPEPLIFTCLAGSCAPLHGHTPTHRFSTLPIRPTYGFMRRLLTPIGSLGSRLAKKARSGTCRASAWPDLVILRPSVISPP